MGMEDLQTLSLSHTDTKTISKLAEIHVSRKNVGVMGNSSNIITAIEWPSIDITDLNLKKQQLIYTMEMMQCILMHSYQNLYKPPEHGVTFFSNKSRY